MLQIVKREDNTGYENILSRLDISDISKVKISEAVSDNGVDGYVVYTMGDDSVTLYDVNANGDLMLCDGLVRSALFLAAMQGIEKAVFDLADRTDLLKLRFISADSNVLEPISEMLSGCEHCKHK